MRTIIPGLLAILLLTAPLTAAEENEGSPPDAANYGLCTAHDANEQGRKAANGDDDDQADDGDGNATAQAGTPTGNATPADPIDNLAGGLLTIQNGTGSGNETTGDNSTTDDTDAGDNTTVTGPDGAPPFQNMEGRDCENAERPGAPDDTPGQPENPGAPDDVPGNGPPDDIPSGGPPEWVPSGPPETPGPPGGTPDGAPSDPGRP